MHSQAGAWERGNKSEWKLTSFELRKQMLELLIEGEEKLEISTIEAEREGPHYTLETIKLLKKRNPDVDEYWLIVGSDTYKNLHTWHKPALLLQEAKVCVAERPGFDITEVDALQKITSVEIVNEIKKHAVTMPPKDISLTKIRELFKAAESSENLTSKKIITFIKYHKLYR